METDGRWPKPNLRRSALKCANGRRNYPASLRRGWWQRQSADGRRRSLNTKTWDSAPQRKGLDDAGGRRRLRRQRQSQRDTSACCNGRWARPARRTRSMAGHGHPHDRADDPRCSTEDQKKEHIPPDRARRTPAGASAIPKLGAGSDPPRCKTKCVDAGDHWDINGSKIWTSGVISPVGTARSHRSMRCQGISFMLIDSHQPAIKRGRSS